MQRERICLMSDIPHIIHYCWFGGNPLPKSALRCIASWRKFLPGYEIREWNESNYDVRKIPYIAEAYEAKKYAFVSDYARFDILHQFGGVYFDTDVEVIKPLDDILLTGPFMGCEIDGGDGHKIMVAPGLGLAAYPQMDVYEQIMEHYRNAKFLKVDGSINTMTVVKRVTSVLKERGLQNISGIQHLQDLTIYPKEYFNPMNGNTGQISATENTRSIHWYDNSWHSPMKKYKGYLTRIFHRLFGENCFAWYKRLKKQITKRK